jgi:thymidylate synthase (FAD)
LGKVIIQSATTKNPLHLIGVEAGVCWNAKITNKYNNIKRAKECIESGHGRVMEFPQVYMILEGYSAKTLREFYTHISGGPTRLQASTRYINYDSFSFVSPSFTSKEMKQKYEESMQSIAQNYKVLVDMGMPIEDASLLLPLGMETKVVVRTNLRNLVDMSHQRMCKRAYWEYQNVMQDIKKALAIYSEEWKYLVDHLFIPKCQYFGKCTEKHSCGKLKN